MEYDTSASQEPIPPDETTDTWTTEQGEALLSPSIVAIFGLANVLSPHVGHDAAFVKKVYTTNMPDLEIQVGEKADQVYPLAKDAQQIIHARSRGIVSIPQNRKALFEHSELLRFQFWLESMAVGMSEKAIGEQLSLGRRTVSRISESMREYLGVTNQASIMYSALLHGYRPSVSTPDIGRPRLTMNRNIHLYLAALGFEAKQAADLTGQHPYEVKSFRFHAVERLGASALPQALVHSFRSGYYSALSIRR